MTISTADLCDAHGELVTVADPVFRSFGSTQAFHGEIVTLKCAEDIIVLREMVQEPGRGKVLVVDGGGSLRGAMFGEKMGGKAVSSGWEGLILNGAIRDVDALANLPFGVRALGVVPRRGGTHGGGQRNVPVTFAGVTFEPRHFVYVDADGIVVAPRPLG
jgi:regulator of ribonuclease activity A